MLLLHLGDLCSAVCSGNTDTRKATAVTMRQCAVSVTAGLQPLQPPRFLIKQLVTVCTGPSEAQESSFMETCYPTETSWEEHRAACHLLLCPQRAAAAPAVPAEGSPSSTPRQDPSMHAWLCVPVCPLWHHGPPGASVGSRGLSCPPQQRCHPPCLGSCVTYASTSAFPPTSPPVSPVSWGGGCVHWDSPLVPAAVLRAALMTPPACPCCVWGWAHP